MNVPHDSVREIQQISSWAFTETVKAIESN